MGDQEEFLNEKQNLMWTQGRCIDILCGTNSGFVVGAELTETETDKRKGCRGRCGMCRKGQNASSFAEGQYERMLGVAVVGAGGGYVCPHGRPTWSSLVQPSLLRAFGA